MSAIRGAGQGVSALVFDDPMMAAEALSIDAAREDRNVARQERQAAQSDRDAMFDRSIEEERAATTMRLVSGLVSSGAKIGSAVSSVVATGYSHAAAAHRAKAESITTHDVVTRAGAQDQRVSHQPTAEQLTQRTAAQTAAAAAERAAGNWRGSAELSNAVTSTATSVIDFVADGRRTAAKEAEKASDRAQEAAQSANERAQEAGDVASRMMNRMEDIARAQRQAEDQRIANIRG